MTDGRRSATASPRSASRVRGCACRRYQGVAPGCSWPFEGDDRNDHRELEEVVLHLVVRRATCRVSTTLAPTIFTSRRRATGGPLRARASKKAAPPRRVEAGAISIGLLAIRARLLVAQRPSASAAGRSPLAAAIIRTPFAVSRTSSSAFPTTGDDSDGEDQRPGAAAATGAVSITVPPQPAAASASAAKQPRIPNALFWLPAPFDDMPDAYPDIRPSDTTGSQRLFDRSSARRSGVREQACSRLDASQQLAGDAVVAARVVRALPPWPFFAGAARAERGGRSGGGRLREGEADRVTAAGAAARAAVTAVTAVAAVARRLGRDAGDRRRVRAAAAAAAGLAGRAPEPCRGRRARRGRRRE